MLKLGINTLPILPQLEVVSQIRLCKNWMVTSSNSVWTEPEMNA